MSEMTSPFLRLVSAHQTPMAMAKPEVIRMAVLAVPGWAMLSRLLLAATRGWIVPVAIDQVCAEHAPEEHDFGEQKEPHAEGGRLPLLLHRLEVVTQIGRVLVNLVPRFR